MGTRGPGWGARQPLEGQVGAPVPQGHGLSPSASSAAAPRAATSTPARPLSLWNTPCFLRSVLILVPSPILFCPHCLSRSLPALGAPRGGSSCCSFSAPGTPCWPLGAGSTSCPLWPGPGHTMIPSPDSGHAMARHRISGCRRHPGGDVIMGDSGVVFLGSGCFNSRWDRSRPMCPQCGQ